MEFVLLSVFHLCQFFSCHCLHSGSQCKNWKYAEELVDWRTYAQVSTLLSIELCPCVLLYTAINYLTVTTRQKCQLLSSEGHELRIVLLPWLTVYLALQNSEAFFFFFLPTLSSEPTTSRGTEF